MRNNNLILKTDSYKFSHFKQYPPKTEKVFSYWEARDGAEFPETTMFGLQYFLKEYLYDVVVCKNDIDEAEEIITAHLGSKELFNRKGWEYILEEHGGRLPIKIKAIPEGMSIPVGNVMMTVENTDPKCFWLTNYIETLISQMWYPCTVATLSREIKKVIASYLEKTGDPSLINFKLHDFGYRGVSSDESAAIGGAAHLVNFMGTDTVAGIMLAKKYYKEAMAGFSIPAAEHSTITSWGRGKEAEAFANMLTQFPKGLVAVVSDSEDIYNACRNIWGEQLKEEVLSRDGILVIRPDSGEPQLVVCEILEILGEKFGFTTNEKGYKVLNPKVRIIQGDGVDRDNIKKILYRMCDVFKWSADNIAFGMGGALLQKLNRDTQRFAFKCSSITVDGVKRDVFKSPMGCSWKKSKAGELTLVRKSNGEYVTTDKVEADRLKFYEDAKEVLQDVFVNGEIVKEYTFAEIRKNAEL